MSLPTPPPTSRRHITEENRQRLVDALRGFTTPMYISAGPETISPCFTATLEELPQYKMSDLRLLERRIQEAFGGMGQMNVMAVSGYLELLINLPGGLDPADPVPGGLDPADPTAAPAAAEPAAGRSCRTCAHWGAGASRRWITADVYRPCDFDDWEAALPASLELPPPTTDMLAHEGGACPCHRPLPGAPAPGGG